ncbi:MAG: HD domain-containing protein [Planctomycetes bacterium]|nr:HD domain-containing protein [Planctomycetota bacterium]
MVTLKEVINHPQTKAFMEVANANLGAIGYTEHGIRHAELVAMRTGHILKSLGFNKKMRDMGEVAGYLHDIGNAINRHDHGQDGAFLVYHILKDLKADYKDIAQVVAAVGNHDEEKGEPVNSISAAVIIADKSDVHRSRVRTMKEIDFDIHDRVNYAVKESHVKIDKKRKKITMELVIDTRISKVMEYFEIFMSRMVVSQKAAKLLGCEFKLVINKTKLL